MDVLISVIIPVFKVERYLRQCIESVIHQSYTNLEIILIDDGSPDNCGSICDHYANLDERVVVLHKKNEGLMSAWIDGVMASKGQYLTFVDSDDWIDVSMIENLVSFAKQDCKQIICCGYNNEVNGKSYAQPITKEKKVITKDLMTHTFYKSLLGEEFRPIPMTRWAKLISKELIVNNIGFCNRKISLGEDVNIIFPSIIDTDQIVLINSSNWYHYRYNVDSIVHSYNPLLFENIIILYDTLINIINHKGLQYCKISINNEFMQMLFLEIKNQVKCGRSGWIEVLKNELNQEFVMKIAENSSYKSNSILNFLFISIIKTKSKFLMLILRAVYLASKYCD